MIHEFSHIVLGTLDIAYSSTGGSAHQNIHALQILATDKTFNNTSALVYSFDKFISSKSSLKHLKFEDYYELPYNNADSFAYATQLLAYSASKKSSRQEQFKSMVSNRY